MNPKPKRPVGITILALAFLWIGCVGTILFPFIGISGETNFLWRQIAAGIIHSEFWLRFTSYLFVSIWFLFYVAYAFIGFGLWKLRNGAHKAILALMEFFAVVSILALPFLVRPAAMAIAVVIYTSLFFAWIIWYLKRPRVCFAFGAWPSPCNEVLPGEPPPGLSKMGKAWVATAIVATLGLWIGSLMFAVESMFHSSEIYTMTIKEAQSSRCVVNTLGVPINTGWITTGSINGGINDGDANLNIPLNGSKGSGHLELEAEKLDGTWEIKSLFLVHNSERMQLDLQSSGISCK